MQAFIWIHKKISHIEMRSALAKIDQVCKDSWVGKRPRRELVWSLTQWKHTSANMAWDWTGAGCSQMLCTQAVSLLVLSMWSASTADCSCSSRREMLWTDITGTAQASTKIFWQLSWADTFNLDRSSTKFPQVICPAGDLLQLILLHLFHWLMGPQGF